MVGMTYEQPHHQIRIPAIPQPSHDVGPISLKLNGGTFRIAWPWVGVRAALLYVETRHVYSKTKISADAVMRCHARVERPLSLFGLSLASIGIGKIIALSTRPKPERNFERNQNETHRNHMFSGFRAWCQAQSARAAVSSWCVFSAWYQAEIQPRRRKGMHS